MHPTAQFRSHRFPAHRHWKSLCTHLTMSSYKVPVMFSANADYPGDVILRPVDDGGASTVTHQRYVAIANSSPTLSLETGRKVTLGMVLYSCHHLYAGGDTTHGPHHVVIMVSGAIRRHPVRGYQGTSFLREQIQSSGFLSPMPQIRSYNHSRSPSRGVRVGVGVVSPESVR